MKITWAWCRWSPAQKIEAFTEFVQDVTFRFTSGTKVHDAMMRRPTLWSYSEISMSRNVGPLNTWTCSLSKAVVAACRGRETPRGHMEYCSSNSKRPRVHWGELWKHLNAAKKHTGGLLTLKKLYNMHKGVNICSSTARLLSTLPAKSQFSPGPFVGTQNRCYRMATRERGAGAKRKQKGTSTQEVKRCPALLHFLLLFLSFV